MQPSPSGGGTEGLKNGFSRKLQKISFTLSRGFCIIVLAFPVSKETSAEEIPSGEVLKLAEEAPLLRV